jgi:hypothetical protein
VAAKKIKHLGFSVGRRLSIVADDVAKISLLVDVYTKEMAGR